MNDSQIQDSASKDSASKDPVTTDRVSTDPVTTDRVSAPARPKGPNVAVTVLGLVALVFAALIIASETTGLRISWSELGPGAIVAIGVVLVVLGAIGLVRRHEDV